MALCLVGFILSLASSFAHGQVPQGRRPGQNGGGYGSGHNGWHRGYGYQRPHHGYQYPQYSSNFNSGWIQRPYPFHLDYYKMKYGGSYEPYMGNLYGPPVVNQFFSPPWPNFTGAFFW